MKRKRPDADASANATVDADETKSSKRSESVGPATPQTLRHSMNCGATGFDGYDAGECTCGLDWRIKLQTEQEMHAAWRKRAEHSERCEMALRQTVEWIASQQNLFFAECSQAEEIVHRCKEALAGRASVSGAPQQCPECKATSDEEASKSCNPNEGRCPIVEAGFWKSGTWPTESEFAAKCEAVSGAPATPVEAPPARDLAVSIVDALRGYTLEFSSNKASHEADYALTESILKASVEAPPAPTPDTKGEK